jgi:two-component system NtrC family response regulator
MDPPRLEDAELERLARYDWPGNVRELKNVIERALLLKRPPGEFVPVPAETADRARERAPESLRLEEVERRQIEKVLRQVNGNKSAAARLLGVSRKTLERRVNAWSRSRAG